jgi:predicted  nucleic acid-binding Zn-ribbon protein
MKVQRADTEWRIRMDRTGSPNSNEAYANVIERDLLVLAQEREALRARRRDVAAEYGAVAARLDRLSLQLRIGRPGTSGQMERLQRDAEQLRSILDEIDRQLATLQAREQRLQAALKWEQLARHW